MNPPRKATPAQKLRHRMISAWRGADEGPIINLPARNLGNVLPGVIKELGLTDRLMMEEIQAAWRTVAGEVISRGTSPESIQRGVLLIRLLQPAIHYAVVGEKAKMLAGLAQLLGPGKIKDIRCRHG
jgi:hypothetical protein